MKKIIICILSIFLIIICIVVYGVYQKNEIKFLELDKVITMERINNVGIEKFWSNYGALSFKCTKIEYHEKTHRVKYMYFEEV